MLEEKVSYEVAEKEVNAWLEKMRVSDRVKGKHKESVAEVIAMTIDGGVVFNDSVPTYSLSFPPIGSNGPLFESLTFKNRFTIQSMQERMKANSVSDDIGRALVNISLATGSGYGPLSKMESEDFVNCTHLVAFF